MKRKYSAIAVLFVIATLPLQAEACSLTIAPGTDISTSLSHPKVQTLCLSTGTYNTSSTIDIPQGKILKGVGATRNDVVIRSSASVVIGLSNNTSIQGLSLRATTGSLPTYGVLSYMGNDQLIWGLDIKGMLISIGVNGSSQVGIADTFMAENGSPTNGLADPNVWISDATNVNIDWGAATGRANAPGGDGEIAVYNSTGVSVYGTHVLHSGASAIYMVNCDWCTIENATIMYAGEWGIDVVSGSDHFTAKNNTVSYSRLGGSVFDAVGSAGGSYTGNSFISNNTIGYAPYCNGINRAGSSTSFIGAGNTVNTGSLVCNPWP